MRPFREEQTLQEVRQDAAPTTHNATPTTLKITSLNCRGLSNSIQYLGELIDDGSDVIVLSEHWLWPFDLH